VQVTRRPLSGWEGSSLVSRHAERGYEARKGKVALATVHLHYTDKRLNIVSPNMECDYIGAGICH